MEILLRIKKKEMENIYNSGNYYIGQFINGLKHGKGIDYYKNGKIKYDGEFVKDKKEGNGKYIYKWRIL